MFHTGAENRKKETKDSFKKKGTRHVHTLISFLDPAVKSIKNPAISDILPDVKKSNLAQSQHPNEHLTL